MQTGATIRPALPQDFEAVFGLLCALWPQDSLNKAVQQSIYHEMLETPASYTLLVAEREGSLVGFCSGNIVLNAYYEGLLCYVMALVVNPAIRGGGIGSTLLAAMERAAATRGCTAVELDSATHRTAAHAFYEAKGYENQGYSFKKYL